MRDLAGLGALSARSADAIERERRLPAELLDALHAGGWFRLLLPRPYGGGEIDPLGFVEIVEQVARNDASTAWCLCQNAVCAMVAAFVAPEVAEEIFARDPRAVLAWGPGPNARAVPVEGGWRMSGSFAFASGGRHASWLGGYCAIEGGKVGRTMLFPADQAQMSDIWQVIGLRGTASDAYEVKELFVPRAFSVSRDDQAERRYPGPLYCLPTGAMFATGFASVAIGLARALIDALVALAQEKTPRGYKTRLRESALFQADLAQAEARLRGARAYLRGALAEVWREVEQSNRLTLEQRMAIRLAASQALADAVAAGDAAYHAAGASAVFERNPFERRFRDLHAVAQQLQGRRAHFETVGRFLLGLEPDLTFA
ncbi:MAG TPA: acyl-CoA dehydrogenase family protein [Burkholderiales bacterium]|nr:acyl-CoA dehydrogenase family protein [Burkholderiales bacterium]